MSERRTREKEDVQYFGECRTRIYVTNKNLLLELYIPHRHAYKGFPLIKRSRISGTDVRISDISGSLCGPARTVAVGIEVGVEVGVEVGIEVGIGA